MMTADAIKAVSAAVLGLAGVCCNVLGRCSRSLREYAVPCYAEVLSGLVLNQQLEASLSAQVLHVPDCQHTPAWSGQPQ
jgi:hypothetical protein